MVLRGRCRRVVARWVACVVAVGTCMVGVGVPASVGDPLPTLVFLLLLRPRRLCCPVMS